MNYLLSLTALASILLMLLCIYCLRLRADVRDERRKRAEAERSLKAAQTELAHRDIAARAAKEMQDRLQQLDAETDRRMRIGFKGLEEELNAALRQKPRANVIQFRRPV